MLTTDDLKFYSNLLDIGFDNEENKQALKDLLIYLYINKQIVLNDLFTYEDKYNLNLFF